MLAAPTERQWGLSLAQKAGILPGSVYPVLTRFEAAGWVDGAWEDIDEAMEGRRKRKYYTLTTKGAREGGRVVDDWEFRTRRPRQQTA